MTKFDFVWIAFRKYYKLETLTVEELKAFYENEILPNIETYKLGIEYQKYYTQSMQSHHDPVPSSSTSETQPSNSNALNSWRKSAAEDSSSFYSDQSSDSLESENSVVNFFYSPENSTAEFDNLKKINNAINMTCPDDFEKPGMKLRRFENSINLVANEDSMTEFPEIEDDLALNRKSI